jgi:ribosome-associated heat shock protein Hsp15
MEEGIRIDKWLWSVRLFKTRSQATEACRSGKARMEGIIVKPSREVRPGDVISLSFPPMIRTVRVTAIPANRVSAKLVPGLMEDLTPPEEFEKLKLAHAPGFEYRERGIGRPTKRHRREIEILKKYLGE